MMKKILQTIRQHQLLEKGMHIVAGLSGGPDSLCMFDVLCRVAEEWQLQLHPVHVNHKFRPGAAEEDQAFVEAFCRERGWPCRTFVCDCNAVAKEEGLTSEEAGRKVRYAAFARTAEEIIREKNVPRERIAIAVAQNANDQCETILFRLLRGSGPDGLSGIAYKRWDEEGNAVIRPLLDVTRAEIESYCRQQGLEPRRDHTNEEPVYMRNRIRLELIPYLQQNYNPNIIETVNRLGKAAAADKDYLQRQAEAAFRAVCVVSPAAGPATGSALSPAAGLDVEALRRLDPAIRMRVFQKAMKEAGLTEGVTAAHLEGLEKITRSEDPSAEWSLPEGLTARRNYGYLEIGTPQEKEPAGQIRIFTGRRSELVQPAEGRLQAVFSLKKLKAVYGEDAPGKLILRGRKEGDFMMIATGGALHRKKLQDLLVDMKVPKAQRDQLSVAAIGNEVLWILPGKTGQTGSLQAKGRFSAAYGAEPDEEEPIIALEYLCRI